MKWIKYQRRYNLAAINNLLLMCRNLQLFILIAGDKFVKASNLIWKRKRGKKKKRKCKYIISQMLFHLEIAAAFMISVWLKQPVLAWVFQVTTAVTVGVMQLFPRMSYKSSVITHGHLYFIYYLVYNPVSFSLLYADYHYFLPCLDSVCMWVCQRLHHNDTWQCVNQSENSK